MLLCSLRWKWLEAALQSAECCLLRAVGCVVGDCDVCRGDVHGCVTHGVVCIWGCMRNLSSVASTTTAGLLAAAASAVFVRSGVVVPGFVTSCIWRQMAHVPA